MFKDIQPLFYGPVANAPNFLLIVIIIWSLFWKGLTLWRSAKNNQKYWFIVLLIINTLGILEIVYLSFFQKDKSSKVKEK